MSETREPQLIPEELQDEGLVKEESWIDEEQSIPPRITKGLVLESGKEFHQVWSQDKVEGYSLDEYIEQIRYSSGHFAVHAIPRLDLALDCLKRGYIKATGLEVEKPSGDRAAESFATHVSVDQVYWTGISRIGILYAVEVLLENKAIMDSPINKENEPNEDWPISGISNDPQDLSHQISNNLGVVFIPVQYEENWAQQEDAGENSDIQQLRKFCAEADIENEFFPSSDIVLPQTTLPTREIFQRYFEVTSLGPKRLYYYWGQKLEDGIKDFISKYNLQPKEKILVSGTFQKVIESKEGRTIGSKGQGDFYAIKHE